MAKLQTRIAMFFSASAVAGAFSGLLAYAIGFMDEIGRSSLVKDLDFGN